MASAHPSPFASRFIQVIGVLAMRSMVKFLYRCRVYRAQSSVRAPVLLAANHRSFLDPPLVGMWANDPISYFARASLWRVLPIRITLDLMHGIPVERENPGISSMKGAVDNLRRGISVLIFPEGTRTRSGRVGRLHEGPALFARRAGVPIVPVYVHRTERAWPRGALLPRAGEARIALYIGSPMVAPANLTSRAQDQWLTRRLQAWFILRERRLYPTGGR